MVIVTDAVVIGAFRYCLGRMTYAVEEFCSEIEPKLGLLKPETLELMRVEISRALAIGQAGMECDAKKWREFLHKVVTV